MKVSLSRIAEFTAARGEYDSSALAQGYSIDSRSVQPGDLFFAVKGERLDGHDFVDQALASQGVHGQLHVILAVFYQKNVHFALFRHVSSPFPAALLFLFAGWLPWLTVNEKVAP